ncbi:MAG: O-antigen ligase family protein [Candidatus Gracilibacteria bacterium]
MNQIIEYCRKNFSFVALSGFWLVALLNPVFKKYDYGAGFPLVIIFGVLILIIAIHEFKKKREFTFLEPLLLLIFFLATVASFYFSQTQNIGLSEVMAFSSMIPLYLLFSNQKNDWHEKFLEVIAIGLFISVTMGFLFYFFYAGDRVFGSFFNILYHSNKWPNAFALFILMAWPAVLFLHKWKFNALRIFGTAFLLAAFLLIYSRGALIVFGGQLVLMFIYFFKRIRLKTIGLFLLIIILGIGIFTAANYIREYKYQNIDLQEKVTFGNGEALTSMQERSDFWNGAIELIKEKPLTGWGPFSFRYAYEDFQKTFLGNADHPHNIFLKIGAENGLIALSAFGLFLLTILITVLRRFPKLSQTKKDFVYLLFVAVAGSFAHNMIDYNLNFMANLTLLFMLMLIIRSTVVVKDSKERFSILSLAIAIIIAVFALYEGTILILSQTINPAFLSYSFYPRNYYVADAEQDLLQNDFAGALKSLKQEEKLNPLDAQALYLEGTAYCDKDFKEANPLVCKTAFAKALSLDDMNNFEYYRDYLKMVNKNNLDLLDQQIIEQAKELIRSYFGYVKGNIHFTAYTENVEAAYETAGLLLPYLTPEEAKLFQKERENMLQTAKILRANKTF